MGKFVDLTGKQFGRLTVIRQDGYNKYRKLMWLCLCACGKETTLSGNCLRSGNTKSCGCLSREIVVKRGQDHQKRIATGTRFGQWAVIGLEGRDKGGALVWLVECTCGSKKRSKVKGVSLRNGHSTSCGCERKGQRLPINGGCAASKVLKTYKDGANKRGLSWELSDEFFFRLTQMNCAYCGTPPSNASKRREYPDFKYSGVDRSDNCSGYTAD